MRLGASKGKLGQNHHTLQGQLARPQRLPRTRNLFLIQQVSHRWKRPTNRAWINVLHSHEQYDSHRRSAHAGIDRALRICAIWKRFIRRRYCSSSQTGRALFHAGLTLGANSSLCNSVKSCSLGAATGRAVLRAGQLRFGTKHTVGNSHSRARAGGTPAAASLATIPPATAADRVRRRQCQVGYAGTVSWHKPQ